MQAGGVWGAAECQATCISSRAVDKCGIKAEPCGVGACGWLLCTALQAKNSNCCIVQPAPLPFVCACHISTAPNPFDNPQIAYLSIVSVGYYLYWQHCFQLLPNKYASEIHL